MNRIRSATDRAPVTNSEGGFTFIEVLISVVLLSLITGALGAAFVTSMRATANSTQSVHTSNDAQLIGAWLIRDAQAAGGTNPSTGQIGPTPGVSIGWLTENHGTDPDPANCVDSTASDQLVIRFEWIDRTTSTVDTHIAKYYFVPAANQLIRVTCDIEKNSASRQTLGNKVASAPTPTCLPVGSCPGMPDLVKLAVSELNPSNASSVPYSYTLEASLRASSPPALTPGNSASVPVLALGGGTCSGGANASGLDLEGNPTMRVYGGVAVDATTSGACPAVYMNGSYTYTAAGLPQQTTVFDPYASLPMPAGANSCPPSGGSNPPPQGGVYQPGLYPQALPAGAALAPGVFVLCASAPSGLHGSGVLLYLAKGTTTWSGGNTTLTAASSGPYAGIVIWQPLSNTSLFSVTGNAGVTLGLAAPGLGSALYAPGAEVDLTGTADLSLGGLVAKTIVITGNHTVTIGVPPATLPTITSPAALPTGLVGHPYTATQFKATGGSGVYRWTGANLDGLTIDQNTGVVSGTPTAAGNFTATITVSDNLGDVFQQTYPYTIDALPTFTSVVPNSLGQGAIGQTVTINGTGFNAGATVSFSGTGITVNSLTVTATKVTLTVTVAQGATLGARDITVTNTDTGTVTKAGAFTVTPGPTVTSTSPSSRGQGTSNQAITINGTNFVTGGALAASFSCPGIVVNNVTFGTATTLNANITIPSNVVPAACNVTVTNGDGSTATKAGAFTVNAAPTILSVNPTVHAKNANGVPFTITGTGFVAGATVVFVGGNQPTVSNPPAVVSGGGTVLTFMINIPKKASGTYDVVVTNPDGGSATLAAGFLVQ